MKQQVSARDYVLAALVLGHLAICMVHGFAHSRAGVALSPLQMSFVFSVILAGPVLGLAVQFLAWPRLGAWMIAATLAGALAFGLVNHFLLPGADHVSHVSGPWAPLFGVTAALLFVTETAGLALAVSSAARAPRRAVARTV
jgi:hypothetical protein